MTIHVLCLNPAIDKIYRIDGFAAGEDYPGQRPESYVGGKGVNVARVLSQLGASVCLYAFLGDMGGEGVRREMEARCACRFVQVAGACRTTVNIVDGASGRETVITEAGPRVTEADVDALFAALRAGIRPGDIVCCSGSIIAGAPEDIYARVFRMCEELGATCALDCNVQALPASLEGARYALGKPNERELCALLGEPRTQDAHELARLARRVMPPYEALLVSMGAQGGVLVTADAAYRARVPETRVVSTVGSGDASLAGALYAMANGSAPEEMLRLAMACGVANAMRAQIGSVTRQDLALVLKNMDIEEL